MSELAPRHWSRTAATCAGDPGPARSRGATGCRTRAREQTGPGNCEQVWCPVCALAALVSGEQHPLLTVIADHSVALLAVIRAMVDNIGHVAAPDRRRAAATGAARRPSRRRRGPGRYQHIPVTVEE